MVEIASADWFGDAHQYKDAAIERTLAFPIDPAFQLIGPRSAVVFALLLVGLTGRLARRQRASETPPPPQLDG